MLDAFAFESVIVAGTAIGLTQATYNPTGEPGAEHALITVEDAQIRWRADGDADPTATAGHVAEPGDAFKLQSSQSIKNFKAIRTGGVSATIRITFLRGA